MKATGPLLTLSLLVAAGHAQAPSYIWSPNGTDRAAGGSGNLYPCSYQSATYQQVHDAKDFRTAGVSMKGLALRLKGTSSAGGRTWEMRITLGHTKITAATITTTFSTNLDSIGTAVVFGTPTTWSKFSWSTVGGTGSVNPPAFTIPFNTTYVYKPAQGNLCWEWRHRNSTSTLSAYMDATDWQQQRGTILAKAGTGCIVKGNTVPASATVSTANVNNIYYFRAALTNATILSSALVALSPTPKHQNLGWCTALEVSPLAYHYGKTDQWGAWAFDAPLPVLVGLQPFDLFLQFAFDDQSQSTGFGLSDMAGYRTPSVASAYTVSRAWSVGANAELATVGLSGRYYGLAVGWLQ